jgi:hypothetical protein
MMTTGELSQWISRGLYRPSEEVRPGQRQRFDWRDLARLAAMHIRMRRFRCRVEGITITAI